MALSLAAMEVSDDTLEVYTVHFEASVGVRCTLVNRCYTVARKRGKMPQPAQARRLRRLSTDRVLKAAVVLADKAGIEAVSMRKLAEELGVAPMAAYKHVASKDELLDGMVDIVVGEIDPPVAGVGWKSAVRQRILSARRSLQRHPWAPGVIESRTNPSPVMLAYLDSMIGMFRAGGFSADLTHHALHAMGSRLYGFSQDVFDDSQTHDPPTRAMLVRQMEGRYPHITELVGAVYHDEASVVGRGCDDQFEFEFALDLLLDGLQGLLHRSDQQRRQA
jgi:AcrR family transcriptional regulator